MVAMIGDTPRRGAFRQLRLAGSNGFISHTLETVARSVVINSVETVI